ncbi:MAG: hypothetical protein ISN28_09945 [Ectothiorhodospiraceae bacterium AqS1]|nr:hypothetical protein [Ectothiorhodospiraceae bacterium AqS1]
MQRTLKRDRAHRHYLERYRVFVDFRIGRLEDKTLRTFCGLLRSGARWIQKPPPRPFALISAPPRPIENDDTKNRHRSIIHKKLGKTIAPKPSKAKILQRI